MNARFYSVIILILCIFTGCTNQKQRIIINDYIPAKQVIVPHFRELQIKAKNGDAVAQYEIGKLYMLGLGVPKSHRMAMTYFESSAEQGYGLAQYYLGLLYFHGEGVVTDFVEGCKWMNLAKDKGIKGAFNYCNKYCY